VASKGTLPRIALALGLSTAAACAQPAAAADPPGKGPPSTVEGVTVQAPKKSYDRQIHDFVASSDAQTRIGQLPRWNEKICPRTIGMTPEFDEFVSNRILAIAAKVGAPAGDRRSCKPNLLILFSSEPQALLDQVLKERPDALGFHYGAGEARRMAVVSHPIQAWYATATQDLKGRVTPDDPDFDWTPTQSVDDILANATAAEGSRLRSGLQSQFSSVLVIADGAKVAGRPIGALADYIAVLALTQSKALDGCRDLPSITNLFSAGCAQTLAPSEATAADIAFLRGLYSTNATLFGDVQQIAIASEMKRSLKAK
jgi:hypothetical protein